MTQFEGFDLLNGSLAFLEAYLYKLINESKRFIPLPLVFELQLVSLFSSYIIKPDQLNLLSFFRAYLLPITFVKQFKQTYYI
jgi:hypothetical protein